MESEDGLAMVETAGMQRMQMKFLSAEEQLCSVRVCTGLHGEGYRLQECLCVFKRNESGKPAYMDRNKWNCI